MKAAQISKIFGDYRKQSQPLKIYAVNIAIGKQLLPDWYLYGEKALIQRIKLLKNRTE